MMDLVYISRPDSFLHRMICWQFIALKKKLEMSSTQDPHPFLLLVWAINHAARRFSIHEQYMRMIVHDISILALKNYVIFHVFHHQTTSTGSWDISVDRLPSCLMKLSRQALPSEAVQICTVVQLSFDDLVFDHQRSIQSRCPTSGIGRCQVDQVDQVTLRNTDVGQVLLMTIHESWLQIQVRDPQFAAQTCKAHQN